MNLWRTTLSYQSVNLYKRAWFCIVVLVLMLLMCLNAFPELAYISVRAILDKRILRCKWQISLCLQVGFLKGCLKSTSMEIGALTSGESLIQHCSNATVAVLGWLLKNSASFAFSVFCIFSLQWCCLCFIGQCCAEVLCKAVSLVCFSLFLPQHLRNLATQPLVSSLLIVTQWFSCFPGHRPLESCDCPLNLCHGH